MSDPAPSRYFQKGFGLKAEVQVQLESDYHSDLVKDLKAAGHSLTAGDLTIRLASEFGFCYGVDRAIDYAYETRRKFPERRIFLVGEIIHNPGVNAKLRDMGIEFLTRELGEDHGFSKLSADDVVILPAFGVTTGQLAQLTMIGSVLVDTTCGSVLNVWKRVERYAQDDFTSIIHGKHYHEETRATASRALAHAGGHYVVVRDMAEAEIVCDYVRAHRRDGRGPREAFLARFSKACSPGFDPDRDLRNIGVANQTTMLMSESLAIAERVRAVMLECFGPEHVATHFRSFDTICSATQDRQDAVVKLLDEGVSVMVVIGGYNSSNTANLAHLCAERVPTYHVATSEALRPDGSIRHLPVGAREEVRAEHWLPAGPLVVGMTAGASTPDSEVGAAIEGILALRGLTTSDIRLPG